MDAKELVENDLDELRDWDLSFYLRCTEEEALDIYNALQALLCTCQNHDGGCRVPFSGMHLKRIEDDGS